MSDTPFAASRETHPDWYGRTSTGLKSVRRYRMRSGAAWTREHAYYNGAGTRGELVWRDPYGHGEQGTQRCWDNEEEARSGAAVLVEVVYPPSSAPAAA